MKKQLLGLIGVFVLVLFIVFPVYGFNIKINGDINNRFEATNNAESISTYPTGSKNNDFSYDNGTNLSKAPGSGFLGNTDDDSGGESNNAQFGETKARLWVTAASDDNKVKGVWAIEVGALKYGSNASVGKGSGGALSGDGVNTETRWLYAGFQMPGIEHDSRLRAGLQPVKVNKWLWTETAMGVRYFGKTALVDYDVGWMRAQDNLTDDDQNDNAVYARLTFKPESVDMKLGVFGVYFSQGEDTTSAYDLSTVPYDGTGASSSNLYDQTDIYLGVDGKWNIGKFSLNWDAIFQFGDVEFTENVVNGGTDNELDRNGYFLHLDVAHQCTKALKSTLTWWYASGDDNPNDGDADNYDNIDSDVGGSVIIFEDAITDDNEWTDAPYLLDKGFQMVRFRMDYAFTGKLTTSLALNYMLLAEDALNGENDVGFEVDLYAKYKIWKGLTFNVAFGYLFAGDALDAFASNATAANGFNGDADDIYRLTGGFRYKF